MSSMKKMNLSPVLKDAHRVTIMGIGSEMRGDDAAGIEVVRRLRERLSSPKVQLIDAGVVPENFTNRIKRFKPSHVVLIDATDLGLKPGSTRIFGPEIISEWPVSTHRLPLSLFAEYVHKQMGAKVVLIGIQPASVAVGAAMSKQAKIAIGGVVMELYSKLRSL
jgi:hydrogenase 3 maturation protease